MTDESVPEMTREKLLGIAHYITESDNIIAKMLDINGVVFERAGVDVTNEWSELVAGRAMQEDLRAWAEVMPKRIHTLREPASTPWHMKGYEAFGVLPAEADKFGPNPTVRKLGLVTFKGKASTTDERAGTEEWPPDEVHNGIASIQFHSYGDSIDGGFLHVIGTDEKEVEKRWHVVAEAMTALATVLWPRPSGSTDSPKST